MSLAILGILAPSLEEHAAALHVVERRLQVLEGTTVRAERRLFDP